MHFIVNFIAILFHLLPTDDTNRGSVEGKSVAITLALNAIYRAAFWTEPSLE